MYFVHIVEVLATGTMNVFIPKDLPSVAVWKMVVESAVSV